MKALAKQQKGPYSLLAPYLRTVIKFATANICTKPNILDELSRFLGHEPEQLLSFTLSHSLPSLVATCSRDEIHAVAKYLHRSVAALLVDKTADILKEVFLLPDDSDMDAGLSFLTHMVAEAAGVKAGSVGMQALINSCIANLLAELVMVMGDEKPQMVKMVRVMRLWLFVTIS